MARILGAAMRRCTADPIELSLPGLRRNGGAGAPGAIENLHAAAAGAESVSANRITPATNTG